jgi:glycosyltransferase involved in cell wall biosynthesis
VKVLFIHLAFPGQYLHLAPHMAQAGHQVVALREKGQREMQLPGVLQSTYDPPQPAPGALDEQRAVTSFRRAANVATRVAELLKSGFRPDVICAYLNWGEALFLKDLVPEAKLLLYCELFRPSRGFDFDFDPEFQGRPPPYFWTRVINSPLLGCLNACDWGITPTRWQWQLFPQAYRPHISVIHDGVDTDLVTPSEHAVFRRNGLHLSGDDEVVTYVARSLEPHRGFHIMMRAIPEIQRRRPKAHVVFVGKDEATYTPGLPSGKTFREHMLAELGARIDCARVHFCGHLPYKDYVALLQISAAHVYFTYPFVLSWSAVEAMAAGCLMIASRTAPVEELIDERRNGILVDFFDHGALAERVAEALRDRADMKPLRDAARRTAVEHYDLKRTCLPAQTRLIGSLVS